MKNLSSVVSFLDTKNHKIYLIIFLSILLCLFFRVYKLEEFYGFEHDQDLYSWIVKDILIDHHPRLVGQLTSIDGVFIGPLFYYLLVPFFAIFKMNPLSATVPILIISVFTVISIYYVFSRIFSKNAGLFGAFIYAVSVGSAFNDRWIVPTQPTVIWSVWYLYALLSLTKGDLKVLPLLGLLMGLVWHIHIALIIFIIPIPIAVFLSKKRVIIRKLLLPALIFLLFTSPFLVFEAKYNYQQIKGLVRSMSEDRGEIKGTYRLWKVFQVSSGAFTEPILRFPKISPPASVLSFFSLFIFLVVTKILPKKYALMIIFWIAINLTSHIISKRPLSEYYFNNFYILTLLFYTLLVTYIFEKSKKKLATVLLLSYFLINLITIFKMPVSQNSYAEKKKVVDYIKKDVLEKKFPCIGINYIADYGRGVGFRYLFWLNDVQLVNAGVDVPVYNIVIPFQNAPSEQNFGIFGIIKPKDKEFINKNICTDPNKQLLPMLGFTN